MKKVNEKKNNFVKKRYNNKNKYSNEKFSQARISRRTIKTFDKKLSISHHFLKQKIRPFQCEDKSLQIH